MMTFPLIQFMLFNKNKINWEKKEYGNKNNPCIIILAGWMTSQWHYNIVAGIIAQKGYFVIVITYDKSILSPKITQTTDNFLFMRDKINDLIKDQKNNIEAIIAISLGTALACMVANNNNLLKKIILNLSGADLADIVWSWDSQNNDFKRSILGQHVLLEILKKQWFHISPVNNINNFKNKSVLLFQEENDEIIPYGQQKNLEDSLKKTGCSLTVVKNHNYNHVLSAAINLLNIDRILEFIKS